MEVAFKITTWGRVSVPENLEKEVLELVKQGKVTCSNDIYELVEFHDNLSYDIVEGTEEQMSLEDNDGQSTIEVMLDGETIFTNQEEEEEL